MSILRVTNLKITDQNDSNIIVDQINFHLYERECLGIIGESGSGKTLTCKGILGLLPSNLAVSGSVFFQEQELNKLGRESMRRIRGRQIAMIVQDPMNAFDPLFTVGYQMVETLMEHLKYNKYKSKEIALRTLETMHFSDAKDVFNKYPHQLSGGMLQRCMIGLSIALQPKIMIADEPTSSLDSINQKEVIKNFQNIRNNMGTAMIIVSHDLGIVQSLADHVIVMSQGKIVEYGNTADLFSHPKHEYTKYLINTRVKMSIPFLEAMKKNG